MNTRGMELTSSYSGKNINMDATAKPGEIQDAEDKFRTVADNNYTWGIEPGPGPSPEPVATSDTFAGDGTTTEFTLTDIPVEITEVTVNSEATTDYTADGKVITFTTAPADEAVIVVSYLKEAE